MTQAVSSVSSRPKDWKYESTRLEGKRAVVTGGTTGIGRTTALLLAHRGAQVMLFGRSREHLDDALADLEPYQDRVTGLIADQSSPEVVERVFETVDERMGGIDILINNAGLAADSVTEESQDQIEYVVQTNLLGYLHCAAAAIPRMEQNESGHIVNVGSMSAQSRGKDSDVYVATKSGVRGWSESLAKTLAQKHIRVSLVEPGLVGADIFSGKKADPQHQEKRQRELAMMRTEDIAETILFCLQLPLRANAVCMQVHQLKSDG